MREILKQISIILFGKGQVLFKYDQYFARSEKHIDNLLVKQAKNIEALKRK